MPLYGPDIGIPSIAASNTTYSTDTVVLSGSNNLTVSYNGSTILFSAGTLNAGNPMQIIASGSAYSTGTVVISGSGGLTASYSGSTILLAGPGPWVQSTFNNLRGASVLTSTNATASTRSHFVFPLHPYDAVFPANITASTVRMLMSLSYATTGVNVAALTLSAALGIYKVSGLASQATLSLVNSASWSWGTNGAIASVDVSNSLSGVRWMTIHSTQWSSSPVFTEGGVYYGAFFSSTAGPTLGSWALFGASVLSTMNISGVMSSASVTNTSAGILVWGGIFSATSAALRASIGVSQLNRQNAMANFVPLIEFDYLTRSH